MSERRRSLTKMTGLPFLAKNRYTIFLVPTIHNDSGYRLPRARRVARHAELVTRLLAFLDAASDMPGVVIDDQVRFVDDVISVIPELAEPIYQAIRDGKLVVGPWYAPTLGGMVSGEALLRNLNFGIQTVSELAADDLLVSYAPPTGNYVRQLPQLLTGYGILRALALVSDRPESLHSTLVGPDGSAIAISGAKIPRLQVAFAEVSDKDFRDALVEGRDRLKAFANSSVQIATYPIEAELTEMSPFQNLAQATKRLRSSHVDRGSLADFFDATDDADSAVVDSTGLIPQVPLEMDGVLSSRIWIAQENADLQNLLVKWAEPLHAWATLLRSDQAQGLGTSGIRLGLIQRAWKSLLTNQAFPEVSGAWDDSLEAEIRHRFDEVRHLGEEVLSRSFMAISSAIDTSRNKPSRGSACFLVVNTNERITTDRVSVNLRLEESLWPFEIVDPDGNAVLFQVTHYELARDGLEVEIDVLVEDIAGIGYRTYYVIPAKDDYDKVPKSEEAASIANEFFEVHLDQQTGTFSLVDTDGNVEYQGLNHFVDEGDRGDCFHFGPLARDTVIDIAANTPLSVTRRVSQFGESLEYFQIYRLPVQLADDGESRLPLAAQFAPLSIRTTVRLTYGIPRADIEVEINNDARDHRLQVRFPLPYKVLDGWIDTHFEVAHIDLGDSTSHGSGDETIRFNLQAFASLHGSHAGLTFASQGLPEGYLSRREEKSSIQVTLLRSVGNVRNTESTNEQTLPSQSAQCTGTYFYSYSLIPHMERVHAAWKHARALVNPMLGKQIGLQPGYLPTEASLLRCESDGFVVSAVRALESESGIQIRGYSVSDTVEEVTLEVGFKIVEAFEVDLNGDRAISLPLNDSNSVTFAVDPHKIKTIALRVD